MVEEKFINDESSERNYKYESKEAGKSFESSFSD